MTEHDTDPDPLHVSRRVLLRWAAVSPMLLVGCGGGGAATADTGPSPGTGDAGGGGSDSGGPTSPDGAAATCEPTTEDALGPFFEDGSPSRTAIAGATEPGTRLLMEGRLLSAPSCAPLAGHDIDLWQADELGNYYGGLATDYRLRGRVTTDAEGRFAFESIKPGNYETATGPRPAHIHVRVWAPGGSSLLVTQIYFAGDPYLAPNDGCGPPTCFSDDPARIVALEPARVGMRDGLRGTFDLHV